MKVNVDAPAKINLFLDIRGKRSDGYHIVSMVMQSISLCDEITASRTDDGDIKIVCSDENIPLDETNTVYKAVELFFKETEKENKGIEIKIKKNIPTEAGLGGGSTDAAAVLHALNKLYDTELSRKELAEIGAEIGADVPFCVYGGTMSASGIGTILSPLPDLPECYLVIVKPNIGVCTKLIKSRRVAVIPGTAFGDCGEGYIRVSYSYSLGHIMEALNRIEMFINNPDAPAMDS